MLSRIRSFLRTLLKRDAFRAELDEEIEFHTQQHAADLVRSGMSPEEAARQARLRFGSVERVHVRSREAHGTLHFEEAVRNVRFALRSLHRSPLFSATFILTIGLCIGTATAVFSVVDAVLWRPLPYPDPDHLALVATFSEEAGPPAALTFVNGRTWEAIRDGASRFQSAVFSDLHTGVNLATEDRAEYVQQQRVGAGFFSTLGFAPARGREFTPEEDVPGGPPVVVLSDGLWRRTFSEDPNILGSTIRLKGEAFTVVGVMPPEFTPGYPADLWTPLRPSRSGEGGGTNYAVVVRFPAQLSMESADALMRGVDLPQSSDPEAPRRLLGLQPLQSARTSGVRQPLLMVLAAMFIMLLVGSANLAGLQFARAFARRPEIATRQALGGGIGSIIRQMLTENIVLGIIGGAVGLLVAGLLMGGMQALVQAHLGISQTVPMDARVLAAAVALTIVATLVFGLAPALQVRGFDLRGVLIGGGGRGVAGVTRQRLRKVFIAGEIALVTTLLFGAGLLVRSYLYLGSLDPGFDAKGVLSVRLSMDDARYSTPRTLVPFTEGTLAEIARIPGVESAAMGLSLPYERPLNLPFRLPGSDPEKQTHPITSAMYITPDYFKTLSIPLLSGRTFETSEGSDSQPVAIVNRAFAEAELSGREAVGSLLNLMGGSDRRIVGMVGDVQQRNGGWGTNEPIWKSPIVYVPISQMDGGFLQLVHTWFTPSWLIQTEVDPVALSAAVTQVIRRHDPEMPIAGVARLAEVVAESLSRPRFEAAFLVVVGAFATLLAAVGLFGIVTGEMTERTREMGVRMALGASPGRAVWTAGLSGLRLVAVGLLIGMAVSVPAGSLVAASLWGVHPSDPLTMAGVVLTLLLVASVASFVPAYRLAGLEPARILREE